MKHTYLSKETITDALTHHAITKKEAQKLEKKIYCQAIIGSTSHK